ncbi:hypothetical protein Adt_37703 [Abeliophyllum distichum]|uniref:Uncharacterized protein n=1 Tax=Abeliophyllum distichum TaxID=126358 RepID=A0ABD1Q139_9LAMI
MGGLDKPQSTHLPRPRTASRPMNRTGCSRAEEAEPWVIHGPRKPNRGPTRELDGLFTARTVRPLNARTAQGRYLRSTSLAQVPRPLELGNLAAWSSKGTSLAQVPCPLGLGHLSPCFSKDEPRSSASPTGTRPPITLFLKEQASLKCLAPTHQT